MFQYSDHRLQPPNLKPRKSYCKMICCKYGLSLHCLYNTFKDYTEAYKYVESVNHKVVVKASGVAAEKGCYMPQTKAEALEAVAQVMVNKAFGAAGDECIIEEWLQGEEVSVLAFCDGKKAVSDACCSRSQARSRW